MRNKQPAVQQSGWSGQLRVFSSIVLLDLLPLNRNVILGRLPERIKAALIARAAEIEYPIAISIAISIANFLDTEALGFVDCKPGRGQ
ncbi:hypothetical protein QUA35_12025 [Microcoleus sp. N9_B2]|uniref:hypothetical protein n=1 Tax=unclassified Microcoleus TaxID=2642155 RepID=UPI002FD5AF80